MKSKFTGDLWGWIGIKLLELLISIVTLGIAMPWAVCMRMRWYAKHTIVDGKRLVFDGKGIQLFGWCLGEVLFSIIPVGVYIVCGELLALDKLYLGLALWIAATPWFIYVLYLPIRLQKWGVKHTHAEIFEDYDWQDDVEYPAEEEYSYRCYGNCRCPRYYRRPDHHRHLDYYRRPSKRWYYD